MTATDAPVPSELDRAPRSEAGDPETGRPTSSVAMRGTAVTLAGQWTKFVVQTASLSVLSHLLTPTDFGRVAMVMAIVGIATVLGDFGLSLAAIQARSLTTQQKSALFWLNAGLGLALAAFVYVLAEPIATYYHSGELSPIVRALSVAFLLNGLAAQFKAELTRTLKFVRLALVDVIAQAAAFGVAVVAAMNGAGYWAIVAQQLTVAGASLLIAGGLAGWWPGRPRRDARMRQLVTFGANTMGVQTITYVSSNVDNVLVGRFWGAAALGSYSRAYNLFELPVQQLAAPLTRVVLPILSRVRDDEARYVAYTARAQLMLSYVLIGSFALAASVAQPMIAIVLGPQWGAAVPVFQVLALGGVFQALGYVNYWVFLSTGNAGRQLRYSVIGRTLMVGLIYVGVQSSPVGAAGGAAAGLFLLWLLYSFHGIPRLGIDGLGQVIGDAVRVVLFLTVTCVLTQVAYHTVLFRLPSPVALACGVLLDVVIASAIAGAVRSVRNDLRTVWETARSVAGRGGAARTPVAVRPAGRHRGSDR